MKSFKQHFLTEALTDNATTVEAAICIAYNMKRNKLSYEDALAQAGISSSNVKKLEKNKEDYMRIANAVIDSVAENMGPHLDHSGRGSSGKNFYKEALGFAASDKTPKADFVGDSKHQISLKKRGSGGASAQLMSAASSEARGVVKAAVLHFENNNGDTNVKLYKEAMDILGNQMTAAAELDMVVEVGQAKDHFANWYINSDGRGSRREEVKKQMKDKTSKYALESLEKHLKAELNILRATQLSKSAEKNLLGANPKHYKETKKGGPLLKDGQTVTIPNKSDMEKYLQAYIKSTKSNEGIVGSAKMGGVVVLDRHIYKNADPTQGLLPNVDPKLLQTKDIKRQITEVIKISMNTKAWQEKIAQFLNTSEELKKWIVYEAASGHFKFTGEVASSSYSGSEPSVANMIMAFTDGGQGFLYRDMLGWASKNTDVVNSLNVSYKGGGRSKYLAMKLMTEGVVEEAHKQLVEELDLIEQQLLTEGIIGDIFTKVKDVTGKVTNALKNFFKKIWEGVKRNLQALLNLGMNQLHEVLGLEVGMAPLKTPKW